MEQELSHSLLITSKGLYTYPLSISDEKTILTLLQDLHKVPLFFLLPSPSTLIQLSFLQYLKSLP